ncbi:hypothetical protein [Gordonia tangerina]|uniref:Uncharacterized protein n=1 Tax=Gordonia tangerina TaxID=2911060 RepID=A0ABS9DLU0_9ACTN|nr:hypothetical protein [Gordonia tangerina]MCF3940197.1 hypothetical protein [Gordonia tangerina]
MPRRSRRIATGSALAALVAGMLAPTASAAPADVTVTPTVSGNTVALTVHNDSAKRVGCEIFGVPADSELSAGDLAFGYQTPEQLNALIVAGSSKKLTMRVSVGDPPTPTGSTTIADGSYDIYWGCRTVTLPPVDPTAEEYWGTTPPLPAGAATGPRRYGSRFPVRQRRPVRPRRRPPRRRSRCRRCVCSGIACRCRRVREGCIADAERVTCPETPAVAARDSRA